MKEYISVCKTAMITKCIYTNVYKEQITVTSLLVNSQIIIVHYLKHNIFCHQIMCCSLY